ncbi:MOSC domain-containing protein [Shewanella baltica]|uniref:MOSC domain-containing protein n=1 Tax=Shewanella baltica TaxID=62322 RepID=UPI00217D120B|nr:MOSC domain-containing protein [Shewanella baltica]EGT3628151.1 MOSC domain-containing protein [Morganella morganii]MCS6137119.1 MOSC domain-containing protein [Shewanella baltica]MCS6237480.1 MOSC domain-containing protein [Shewanella baltica]MCS6261822.1 MOSC domain-containing protein [Shewanella baltica]MCS6272046.1 MOSC domain-containing protein [Shewanella baltica]
MPKLLAIAYKTVKRGPMNEVLCANVTQLSGVEKDVFGRPGKRQVTVLSKIQWQQACHSIEADLPWTTRRANLLVDDLVFSSADVGKHLHIGELRLEITGETDPCKKMEIAHIGLEAALTPDWRGGVTCRVLNDAMIHLGDEITLVNPS